MVAWHADHWGLGSTEPDLTDGGIVVTSEQEAKLKELMESCAVKAAVSGVTGFALGGVMGVFFASMDAALPGLSIHSSNLIADSDHL
jgi:hypothetical protein